MLRSLAARRSPRPSHPDPRSNELRELREALTAALAAREHTRAIGLLARIEELEPRVPRWPHKRADLMRGLHRDRDAFFAYATATRLYLEAQLPRHARAMAEIALASIPDAHAFKAHLDSPTLAAFEACMGGHGVQGVTEPPIPLT